MSRARIAALALVNWKGVFYERYLLDRHVTALEGSNGAGKTTVMIAAYVVLLPDMSKLRFTNLGESGAIGGDRGIWGRLGEAGRPSYAVLDLEAGGERLLAGVRLVRASEPTVEPTAFVISGLAPAVRLSDILLVRRLDGDHVPQLDEIGAAAIAAGGAIEVFKTIKDYFAALFERGITPMRLTGDEDRTKLNDMLRTSMTGGISRALTSELRGFLLKEESGLGEALSRMRANLEACRRTRAEVAESRQLEKEITAIYEAGADMFAAAVHAARLATGETQQRLGEAERAVADAVTAERERQVEIQSLAQRERELEARKAAARAELARVTAERDRQTAVAAVTFRLGELDRERAVLDAGVQMARSAQAVASAERAAARAGNSAARDAYDRASLGLAHVQQGLDELVRRAHGHRQLIRRLAEARELLRDPSLAVETAAAALARLEAERAAIEAERAEIDRQTRGLAARRDDHAKAIAALVAIDPAAAVLAAEARHSHARAVLVRLAAHDELVGRAHELDRDQRDAARLAARQRAAQALAGELRLLSTEPGGADASSGSAIAQVARALDAVERALQDAETAAREAAANEPRAALDELRVRLAALDDRRTAWHAADTAVQRLSGFGAPPVSRAEVIALRDRVLAEHHAVEARRSELTASRERTRLHALSLERGGSTVDPELVRLRDELGGELLAERFDDLDVETASWVEARLGPLAQAVIVDDPAAAAKALQALPRAVPTVWLVAAGAPLEAAAEPAAREAGEDVVSVEPFGVRVTRRADPPGLGWRARERQAAALHDEVAKAGDALDELTARAAKVAGWRRDADQLVAHMDAWLAGDPANERAQIESEIAARELAVHARDEQLRVAHVAAAAARTRRDGLRRLLGDAGLLDEPDHEARARALAASAAELSAIRAELARVVMHRSVLAELLDSLRQPPPSDDDVAVLGRRSATLAGELDRLFLARAALEDVLAHRHAAGWADAEQAIAAQADLAPALERQHADARAAVQAAEQAEAAADAAWEAATSATHEAEGQAAAAAAHRDRAAAELAALGGAGASGDDSEQSVAAAIEYVNAIEAELRALVTAAALATERRDQAGRNAAQARSKLTEEARGAGPASATWAELRARADDAGLLATALASPVSAGRTSMQLTADAWSKREVLLDRLARARGGSELADAIRALPLDGPSYLTAWQNTREWLRHRVPAQVVEVDDPLAALERLRSQLDVLEGRLARQEHDLRGASEDVARGIDIQLRRAGGQVRRLNQQLDGIRFGSVHGIRIELRRIERMEQILRALRLGEAQELLFLSAIPIEEALDEIFRRYGGGRSGGARLLDYREYLELAVQIRRQTGGDWEAASPTRLSTGEAIGVGAAMMMVVLTEWERDANLLRSRRTGGSLRFLFLDEANRLSRDNLGVLFDLCHTLDLQLLIAAPEVARAEGNTTYRLVRQVSEDGREEVIVSGRRAPSTSSTDAIVADSAIGAGEAGGVGGK